MTHRFQRAAAAVLMTACVSHAIAATGVSASSTATVSNLRYQVYDLSTGNSNLEKLTFNTGNTASLAGEAWVSERNVNGPLNEVRSLPLEGSLLITSTGSVSSPSGVASATVDGAVSAVASTQVSPDALNRELGHVVNGFSQGYEASAFVANHPFSTEAFSWTLAPGARLVVLGQYSIDSFLDLSQVNADAIREIDGRPSTGFSLESFASFNAEMVVTSGQNAPGVSFDSRLSNSTASILQGLSGQVYNTGPVFEVKPFRLTVTNAGVRSISGTFMYQATSGVHANAVLTIPEPSSNWLMGLGFFGVVLGVRRRRVLQA